MQRHSEQRPLVKSNHCQHGVTMQIEMQGSAPTCERKLTERQTVPRRTLQTFLAGANTVADDCLEIDATLDVQTICRM